MSSPARDASSPPGAADLTTRLRDLAAAVAEAEGDSEVVITGALDVLRLSLCARDAVAVRRSLSLVRGSTHARRAATVACTDEFAAVADRAQLADADGPVMRALSTGVTAGADACGVAVVAAPLADVGHPGHVLTVYRLESAVPPAAAELRAVSVAAAGLGLVLSALAHRNRAENLDVALQSSRRIGAAIGVLMARRQCTYDQAFGALRDASQRDQRKLRDIADEVVLTGVLAD